MISHRYQDTLDQLPLTSHFGRLVQITPGRIESLGPSAMLGDICRIYQENGGTTRLAEVIAFSPERTTLMPLDDCNELAIGDTIERTTLHRFARVGPGLSGRVVDALANPLDGLLPCTGLRPWPLRGQMLKPIERSIEPNAYHTGMKVVDGCLPLARGQRIGIFAASGVGKTTLIEQIMQNVDTDHIVVCLVGERGREVASLWKSLQNCGLATKATVLAATSDESAPLRARVVNQAMAQAEFLRSQNKHVAIFVDSVTRYAMALREMGLAAGEPPTVRAYTPNVFTQLPRIVERCGGTRSAGSVTAFFTILSETDDNDDPIVEVMKSLLDGHIILSRRIADSGRFPAVDILQSVSRLAEGVLSPEHRIYLSKFRAAMSQLEDARLMIESGLHKQGQNASLDKAISLRTAMERFLEQKARDKISPSQLLSELKALAAQL